jgi:hypothetical protein
METLTSWDPLGHSRSVTGLLYFYLYLNLTIDATFHILSNSLFTSRHISGSDTDQIVTETINNKATMHVRRFIVTIVVIEKHLQWC